ncbi:MAG TPA: tetratricopeptide repeat-containing sensor histidine kinase [Saprospiraceae bacterium]|nr:tetratricopeptide repeat-containing sensor histidine kinase [Saprospiraceae bacterium]
MKPKYLIILFLLQITYFIDAQPNITYDSLANLAKKQIANNTFEVSDSKPWLTKNDRLSDNHNYIKTLMHYMETTQLCNEDQFNILFYVGGRHFSNNEYSDAEIILKRAYELGIKKVGLLSNLGAVQNYLGKNQQAIKHYLECIDLAKRIRDLEHVARCNFNLGNVYADIGIPDKSLNYFRTSAGVAKKIQDTLIYVESLKNIGIHYLNITDLDSAMYYFTLGKDISTNSKYEALKMQCIQHIGICYTQLGDQQKAITSFNIAEKFYKDNHMERDLANVYYDFSLSYNKLGEYDIAIEYLKKNYDEYNKMKDIFGQQDAAQQLATTYKSKGDYKNALLYSEKHFLLYDSLRKIQNIEEITELRLNHEFESEKAVTKAAFQAKIEKKNLIQRFLIFGLIAISLLMYFWYRAYRFIKKSKETITSQHAQLQILNEANENLIYSLSHDIKEPLLGVMLLLQKLKIDDPYLSQASSALEKQVTAVNIIMNNLLQNKINNSSDANSICDLKAINETIDSVVKSLDYNIKEKNITINNKLKDQIQDITLKISRQKLYLVLLNVVSNAVKHSDHFGSIDIFSENNFILLRDYGKGIDKEILEKIEENKIVTQTNKTTPGSTGLGLYLIKNLLQDTDIKMTIQNAQGRGTIVAIG